MSSREIDPFTSERVLEAAARGETVSGGEDLGRILTALHQPPSASEAAATLPVEAVVRPASTRAVGRITRRTGVAAAAAVLALSGVAAAVTAPETFLEPLVGADEDSEESTSDDGPDDTVFNFGYDEELQLFVWNTSPTDGPYDCSLGDGPLEVTYGANGEITVEQLASEETGEPVTFEANDGSGEPLEYDSGPDCVLNVAEVAGPNGQINHGMFMKLFNSLYEGRGHGCVNRFLAQSDLGKGDQQIRVSDVADAFESVTDGDTGVIDFETVLADCERGNGNGNRPDKDNGPENSNRPDKDDGPENGNRPDKDDGPENSNRPDKDDGPDGGTTVEDTESGDRGGRPQSPGRSGDAPGRKK